MGMIVVLGWVGTLLCIIGSQMVATKQYRGFIVFFIAELFLLIPQIQSHVWNQVALIIIFEYMNIQGIRHHSCEIFGENSHAHLIFKGKNQKGKEITNG